LHYCNNLAAYPSASGEQPSSDSDSYRDGTLIYVALQYTRFTRNYNYL
jgi:hypothetical protein